MKNWQASVRTWEKKENIETHNAGLGEEKKPSRPVYDQPYKLPDWMKK